MRILIIEDEEKLAKSLKRALEETGYAVDYKLDGISGERHMSVHHQDYDILLLDVTLPGKDGIAVCDSLRTNAIMTPIIMLTARDTTADKVRGLDHGADDYIVKPFSYKELISRIRALARRPTTAFPATLEVGSVLLNPSKHEVWCRGEKIVLTLKEFRLLEFFMEHENETVSRQDLIDHLWDFAANPLSRVVDVHVNNLRNKLAKYCNDVSIESVRGIGYCLRA
jgi:DNA-binding response OmpR family regulator